MNLQLTLIKFQLFDIIIVLTEMCSLNNSQTPCFALMLAIAVFGPCRMPEFFSSMFILGHTYNTYSIQCTVYTHNLQIYNITFKVCYQKYMWHQSTKTQYSISVKILASWHFHGNASLQLFCYQTFVSKYISINKMQWLDIPYIILTILLPI